MTTVCLWCAGVGVQHTDPAAAECLGARIEADIEADGGTAGAIGELADEARRAIAAEGQLARAYHVLEQKAIETAAKLREVKAQRDALLAALKVAAPGFAELHAADAPIGCPACEEFDDDAIAERCPAVRLIEAALAKAGA